MAGLNKGFIMELRDYQASAIEQVEGEIVFGSTEVCLGAPTSFGKTITSGHFIKDQVEQGKSVVFMMNLTALVEQTIKMLKTLKIPFKVIAAEFDGQEFDHQAQVTVCMQQTLYARLDKIEPPKCDVLIIDEFHISFRTDTMEAVKRKLKPEVIFGLSATPYDEKGYALPHVDVIQTASIRSLTEEGYLTPLRVVSVKFAEDVDLTAAGAGEYTEGFLNTVVNTPTYINNVVRAWEEVAKDRKTIVFSTGIEHSIQLANEWKSRGYKFEAYHSKLSKKEAKQIMDDFRKNKIQGLVSVNKVLVGFDMPDITCGVACRPTRTRRVWVQASGRLIRFFEGKKDSILLDCAQWTKEHGFIDEAYHPPELGDKEGLSKAKAEAGAGVLPLLLNAEEPTEVERKYVVQKIEELEQKAKKIPELHVKDLVAIYETSIIPKQILNIAYEMNARKTRSPYTDKSVNWVADAWEKAILRFPQYEQRLLKTLKTMAKNKVAQGKKLNALYYVVQPDGWLMEQTPYCSYEVRDSVDVTEAEERYYNDYGITEDEIPF